jgi:hypothetical protein
MLLFHVIKHWIVLEFGFSDLMMVEVARLFIVKHFNSPLLELRTSYRKSC